MTSTVSWVRARSGAENQMKVTLVTAPVTPASISAARRWNFACHAAPTAATPPIDHNPTKIGDSGISGRSPAPMPRHSVQPPANSATTTTAMIWR